MNETGWAEAEKVRFQGRVVAVISHELKNALATVSESAGLISDILSDSAVDPETAETVGTCAEAISEDLRRSFDVIASLNRFAHSADEPVAEVEVAALLELTVRIAGYLSTSRPVTFREPVDRSVKVSTCPLLLEDLVFRILQSAFARLPLGEGLEVEVRERGDGAEVAFYGVNAGQVPSEAARRVLLVLGGEWMEDAPAGAFGFRLRSSIGDALEGDELGREEG